MVKIIIDNIYSKIVGHLPPNVVEDLDAVLSYKVQGARFIKSVKEGRWDGRVTLFSKYHGQSFFTGLLGYVRQILKDNNVEFIKVDNRQKPSQNLTDLTFTGPDCYEERDYQSLTVERSQLFTRGILGVCTGGGKTMIVTRLISELKTSPFIFYVLTKDLMRQAHGTLSRCLNEPIGMIGDGKCDIKNITVCTIQTAINALEWGKKLKLSDYCFDEEDKWDETGIESEEKAEKIKRYISSVKGIYFDECVTGDTEILTEQGKVRIDEVDSKKCKYVLSYNGKRAVFKPISKWMDKGEKKVLEIKLSNGKKIKCTKDHLIYTEQGWLEAGQLMTGNKVLCANVDVERLSNEENWQTVVGITDCKSEKVYDISVDDTHCFFGNGMLVHNCHHVAAKTCKRVLTASPYAYWRYGGSATPYRETGDGIMIEAMFGGMIVDVSASYLIERGFLIKPYIFFEPIPSDCTFHSYQKVYSYCISKNESFNKHVAETAQHLVDRGLSTLILVKTYPQGNMIKSHLSDVEFVTGKMSSKKREKCINDLREKKKLCMIATTLADEGLDIPTLDAVLLAGGGASATRVNQRVGRVIRPDLSNPDARDKAIVVCYGHDARFLTKHTKKIRSLLKKEKAFELCNSMGSEYICDEIDRKLGFK